MTVEAHESIGSYTWVQVENWSGDTKISELLYMSYTWVQVGNWSGDTKISELHKFI